MKAAIIRAVPTCTLWVYQPNQRVYHFRGAVWLFWLTKWYWLRSFVGNHLVVSDVEILYHAKENPR